MNATLIMTKTFGEWATEQLKRRGWTTAYLADRLGTNWARTNRVLNDEPKKANGEAPQVRKETAKKFAIAFGLPVRDGLIAAGYSSDDEGEKEIRIREPQSPHADDIPVDQFPEDVQRVFGLYGRVTQNLPPGPAREAYMKKLEASALSDWEMLLARLEAEEGPEEPRRK